MFLELPLEITLKIISQLEFEDKLNLKATCRKLNDLITKAILYEDLNLIDPLCDKEKPEYKIAVDTFLQKFIDNEFDGSVVKILHVDMTALSDHIISQLSDLFPNIKRLFSNRVPMHGYSFRICDRRKFNLKEIPIIKWRDTIEKIDLEQDWDHLITDLLHHTYPRLTELTIVETAFVFEICKKHNNSLLFHNAPLLTTLTLYYGDIDLEILEAIHAGFPLLQSLKIENIIMQIEREAALSSPIVPANNLTYLELNYTTGFNKNGVVLDYILKKYTNLKELIYSIDLHNDYSILTLDEFEHNSYRERDYEIALASSIAEYPIYSAFEAKFFSNLPKTLKTLTLKMANRENAIMSLAQSGINITRLDFLGHHVRERDYMKLVVEPKSFVGAHMLKKIKKLKSLRTLKIPIDLPRKLFTQDIISLTVTKLYLCLHGKSPSIESLLFMFPNLEELYIYTGWFLYNKKYRTCQIKGRDGDDDPSSKKIQSGKVYPKQRILEIKHNPIHPQLRAFVEAALPNLNRLLLS